MDSKMKKMAELQLSVVSDPKNRKAIENQVQMTYECLLPLLTSLAANSDVGAGSYTSGGNSFCGLLVQVLKWLHFCHMGNTICFGGCIGIVEHFMTRSCFLVLRSSCLPS